MFQMMSYPNRTHAIGSNVEGDPAFIHLGKMYSKFLRENCPPGGRTEEQVKASQAAPKPFVPLP